MGCVNIQCLLQCSMKRGEWMGWRKGEGKFPERDEKPSRHQRTEHTAVVL